MEWGILVISIVFLAVAYVVIQGTRATLAYRRLAAAGDVSAIRELAQEAIDSWRSVKRPKEVPPEVWRGIQSVELVDVGPDFVRVSCQAEGEHRLLDGRWVEMASPLQEGMAVTARAADMLLYEVPNARLASVQIDVYTTFREADGTSRHQCILSTIGRREAARGVDWENWSAAEIVDAFGGRYRLGDSGQALPIDPDVGALSAPAPAPSEASAGGPSPEGGRAARARR